MSGMEKQAALAALAALSQETRLDIFRLLVQAGPEGRSAGTIGETLGVAPATLSFHLSQLNHAGLILQRRESRSLIYSANYDGMNALMAFMTENCCGRPATPTACIPACAPTPAAASIETSHSESSGETDHEAASRSRCGC